MSGEAIHEEDLEYCHVSVLTFNLCENQVNR